MTFYWFYLSNTLIFPFLFIWKGGWLRLKQSKRGNLHPVVHALKYLLPPEGGHAHTKGMSAMDTASQRVCYHRTSWKADMSRKPDTLICDMHVLGCSLTHCITKSALTSRLKSRSAYRIAHRTANRVELHYMLIDYSTGRIPWKHMGLLCQVTKRVQDSRKFNIVCPHPDTT